MPSSPLVPALHRLRLPGGSQDLPVLTVQASAPGACAAVTANLHGDELTGVGVAHTLLDALPTVLRRGQVVIYPSLNPSGLAQSRRTLPEDDADLNRSFPGDPRGGPSQRHASAIWEDLRARRPDLLLDLHADSGQALPYALVDRALRVPPARRAALEARSLELAEASGFTVLREFPDEAYQRYNLDRSLTGAALNRLELPTVTLECGPRGSFDPQAAEDTLRAVLGILTAAGLVDQPCAPHPRRASGGPWRRDAAPRARHAGLYRACLLPGSRYAAGEVLAVVRSLDGQHREELRATQAGLVIALPERGWVAAGGGTGTVAVEGV